MDLKTFAIAGGDLRNVKLAEYLAKDGLKVKLYGFKNIDTNKIVTAVEDLNELAENSDVIIGPIPCSLDGISLNCSYFEDKIYINELFRLMNKDQIFIAGRIDEKIKNMAAIFNIRCLDLLDREEMSVLNAVPTAEGAIQIAMEELPITLHNSNALVMGFGRIGKILAKMLYGLGANVWVEARKYSDIAWIESYGYKPINLKDMYGHLDNFNVIFNTIPSIVIDERELQKIKKDCLLIDLASKPGGINFQKAKEFGLKSIWALSLPGKVAPATAAKFIRDTVYNILNEL